MRKLSSPQIIRQGRRAIVLAVAIVLAAGLLVASPVAEAADGAVPNPEDTTSVPVTEAPRAAGVTPEAEDKTVPLPEPTWPDEGKTVEVGVEEEFPAAPADVSVRSEDPEQAPEALSVESLGKLPNGNAYGPGVAYTLAPMSPEPVVPEGTSPETPTPTEPRPSEAQPTSPADAGNVFFRSGLVQAPVPEPETSSTPTPEPTKTPDDSETEGPGGEAFSAPIEVQLAYGDFAGAYGGNWGSRLTAVQLSDCSTVDDELICETTTPLESTNDTETQTVTAQVPAETYSAGPTTMALTAAPASDKGDYAASPLAKNSEWAAGGNSGDFSWSHPLAVPPGSNGPTPDLSISYSSGSVDGRTSSTNNQTSVIGEGFNLDMGFVERSYSPCSDGGETNGNAPTDSDDLCWRNDNLTISLGGKSSKIIQDTEHNSKWRMRTDDGTQIRRVVGGSPQNNDNDGEYWVATTPDGTKYYYGVNKRFAGDTNPTNSVSVVPVYGSHTHDPCHEDSYKDSRCAQAWRWGLDYVVDPNGNTMSIFYEQDQNLYGAEDASFKLAYDRAARMTRIEYGTRVDDAAGRSAPAKVTMSYLPRCIPNTSADPGTDFDCSELKEDTAYAFPDVPYDRVCNSNSASCEGRTSPTFFSKYRLKKITTAVLAGSTSYDAVNTWTLEQSFPRTGDGTDRALWLRSIDQEATGGSGGPVSLPKITFGGEQRENRVDGRGDAMEPFYKYRVNAIRNGAGGVTAINYSQKDCNDLDQPNNNEVDKNKRRCFPNFISRDFAKGRQIEFFHKYLVDSVVESDLTGGAPNVTTSYEYSGGAGWRFDTSNLERQKYRTWSDWRGYPKVVTKVGDGASATWSETLYMRGMNHNWQLDGSYTDVKTDDPGLSDAIPDSNQFSGFARRTLTKSGADVIDQTVNSPWSIKTSNTGVAADDAFIVQTKATETKTRLAAGGDRITSTSTTFDDDGRPITELDNGDTSVSSDNRCTKTTYADNPNTNVWIRDRVASQITTVGDCNAVPDDKSDVISASETYYDSSATLGAAPTRGLATMTKSVSGFSGNAPVIERVDSVNAYDSAGRVTSTKDAMDGETKTQYNLTHGVPTEVVVTNAEGQVSSQKLNREWGSVSQQTNVAGAKTDHEYDGLGRVIETWVPGREKASGASATYQYDYRMTNVNPNVVTTRTLNASGGYSTSKALFDGLMRPRQTQSPAANPDGGRMVTEQRYDSHGWLESERGPYYNASAIGDALVQASPNSLPAYTDYDYDHAGRVTKTKLMSHGSEKWQTKTEYGGDRTTVTLPNGGTKTTTIVDARGQTTSLRQYDSDTTFDETDYTYTPSGKLATVKTQNDPGRERPTWSYEYDIRGLQTEAHDPDKGLTATTYDSLDRPKTTKDAEGNVLWTGYDKLGRKTELRDASGAGNLRASWLYDTQHEGSLTSSTRHTEDGNYTTSYTYDDAARPTSSTLMVPESAGDLYRANGYKTSMSYYANGLPRQVLQPSTAGTGVTNEALHYTYDDLGNVKTFTGAGAIVAGTTYTADGLMTQRALGPTIGKAVYDTRDYDNSTRRLTRQAVSLQPSAGTTQLDLRYGYDASGNVTKVDDVATAPTASPIKQCFDYDYLRRMTQAWSTSTTDCAAPTASTLGTQTPYWDKYTFDKSGNRRTWDQVRGAGAGAVMTTHTSTYPAPSSALNHPHAPTSVTSAIAGGATQTETLSYDATGNTKTRAGGDVGGQEITWDKEGHQKAVKNTATEKVTSYVYDADGNRLTKKDQTDDSTTLYVGNSEYKVKAGTKSLVRNYSVGGEAVATRTLAGLTVVIADRNNSGQLAINGATLTVQQRRFTPFGEDLKTPTGAWPNDHGYLDKTKDTSTGTTHLGAREYDPKLGRFLSVDPVMDTADPQQMNGYAYANNTPVTSADPTGLYVPCEGACIGKDGKSNPGSPYTKGGTSSIYNVGNGKPNVGSGTGSAKKPRRTYLTLRELEDRLDALGDDGMAGDGGLDAGNLPSQSWGEWWQGFKDAATLKMSRENCLGSGDPDLCAFSLMLDGSSLVGAGGIAKGAAGSIKGGARGGRDIPFGPATEDAWIVLDRVDAKGSPLHGYKGGKTWNNDGSQGATILPTRGANGSRVAYREWDLSPKEKGVPRDGRRLVTGDDGSAYYTTNHYVSFLQIR